MAGGLNIVHAVCTRILWYEPRTRNLARSYLHTKTMATHRNNGEKRCEGAGRHICPLNTYQLEARFVKYLNRDRVRESQGDKELLTEKVRQLHVNILSTPGEGILEFKKKWHSRSTSSGDARSSKMSHSTRQHHLRISWRQFIVSPVCFYF